jgi:uncharacterized membrane protein
MDVRARTPTPELDPLAQPALNRAGVPRVDAIDMLRGFVIVVMVLDHVRDFFHTQAFLFDPTDPTRATAALFFTRWITHLCAPTFVFLSGVSAYLQHANGKDRLSLSRYLLTRGLWLVVLEVTVVNFGFNFAPMLFLQVIWAIGVGMVILSALVWLSPRAVLIVGAIIVAGHNLLAPIDAANLGAWTPVWRLAMEPGLGPGFVAYPAIPWLGVMCLGYGLGPIFFAAPARRRQLIAGLGLCAFAAFLLVRAINVYGDPAPWSTQSDFGRTVMSFLNVTKYPPSLSYALATLGVSLLLLPALEGLRGLPARMLLVFGRTPLFTYVLHIYLVHGAALLVAVATGLPAGIFVNFLADPMRTVNAHWGFGLPVVYLVWALVIVCMYPLSRWFAGVKRRRRDWWLGYL